MVRRCVWLMVSIFVLPCAVLVAASSAALAVDVDGKAPRFPCPVNKPQQIYGHTANPRAVLEEDETWTADMVYLVHGPISVKKTLTIQAGTVICMTYADYPVGNSSGPPPGSISIDENATVRMLGTADEHIIFTSQNGENEYWGGMYFAARSRTDESTLQYVDVYNAGGAGSGPALSTFPDYKSPPLDLQHVTYYSLQKHGLSNQTSGFTPETRIVVNNYTDDQQTRFWYGGYPVLLVHPWGAHSVTADTFKIGDIPKPVRYIQLDHAEGMNIDTADVVLHKLDKDLAWRNIGNMKMNGYPDEPPTFKIDPGVTVAVNANGYIYIGNGGSGFANMQAVGTEDQPIIFTSDAFINGEDPQPGDWRAIEFFPGNFCPSHADCATKKRLGSSRFEHVIFEYGGGLGKDTIWNCNDGRSDRTAVLLFSMGLGYDYEGPEIMNSVWRNNLGSGVRSRCNVGRSGGCLLTNYEDPKFGNRFEGYDSTAEPQRWPTTPVNCPAG